MASDSEYRLLEVLSREENASQRQVAKKTGLSLGMVNLVIKRLAKTGYIKVSAINGQSVRYVLTPKGSAEVAQRSYDYLLHVVSSFGTVRDEIAGLVRDLHGRGKRRFVIYGQSDVADVAEFACNGVAEDLQVLRQADGDLPMGDDIIVLDCRPNIATADRVGIDVVDYLSGIERPPTRYEKALGIK